MSLQSFETGVSAVVAEPVPFVQLHSIPGWDQQIFTPVDQQDAQLGTEQLGTEQFGTEQLWTEQLGTEQFAPATDTPAEVKVAQDDSNQLPIDSTLTLESVLQDIQEDYENGLFYSFRDQVPFFYPPLPGVIVTDEQGVPIEEQQPATGE